MSRAEGEGRQVPGVDPTDAQAVQPKAGGLDVSWTRADAGGPPELLTVPEAARWLGLGRSTLYAALAAKRVPVSPIEIGGRVRLSRRRLEPGLVPRRRRENVSGTIGEEQSCWLENTNADGSRLASVRSARSAILDRWVRNASTVIASRLTLRMEWFLVDLRTTPTWGSKYADESIRNVAPSRSIALHRSAHSSPRRAPGAAARRTNIPNEMAQRWPTDQQ